MNNETPSLNDHFGVKYENTPEWENEFDDKFFHYVYCSVGDKYKSFIRSLLSKERANWLRSEIEKLVGLYIKSDPQLVAVNAHIVTWEQGYNHAIDELITRYTEELKVLESK